MLPPTPAEFIGVGPFWGGEAEPDGSFAHPSPFRRGSAMGQHLAMERLVRIAEERLIYLVNNLSRKWGRRMCWACGNKYTPNSARCCDYCSAKLEDQRFLMTQRWDRSLFEGFETMTKERVKHFGLISPVYAFYRHNMLMAVYHYDGGALLLDMSSPLNTVRVLSLAIALSDTLAWLHQSGVVLRPFRANNVLLMPDGTPRFFDLDAERVLRRPQELYRDPAQPALRDTVNLASLLLPLARTDDLALTGLLQKAAAGMMPGPIPFKELAQRLLMEHRAADPPPPSRASAYSDLGLYRSENQDAWAWKQLSERAVLYAVADGMGGLSNGRDAADLALKTLVSAVSEQFDPEHPEAGKVKEAMTNAFRRANDAVYRDRRARNIEMGCTLTTALVVDDRHVFLTHTGDSSAWMLRAGKLDRLTAEHTVAAELLLHGKITHEQYASHPASHILVSAIGMEPKLAEVDFHVIPAKRGDRFLLCSDGLTGEVSEEGLRHHLTSWADRSKAVRELVRSAYAGGGHDNITVLVLDFP